jgi:hypothetical protein
MTPTLSGEIVMLLPARQRQNGQSVRVLGQRGARIQVWG